MFKQRSFCDSEREHRQNKDPLDEGHLDWAASLFTVNDFSILFR